MLKILDFKEMTSIYIKILKKTASHTELEMFKYNIDISCCVPIALFFNLNEEARKILGDKEWNELYDPKIEKGFY